jgi:transcriptional regulator of acetoin/glycerol metabolism
MRAQSEAQELGDERACALLGRDGHVRPLDEVERLVLVAALCRYDGNISSMSKALQIGRGTLYRRLAHHELSVEPFRLGTVP